MTENRFGIVHNRKNKIGVYLVAVACFLSNISQVPFFVSSGMSQKLSMPMWIILLLYVFWTKQVTVYKNTIKIYYAVGLVFVLIVFLSIITDNSYFTSSVFQCLFLSFFICCLGTFVGKQFTDESLKMICLSYVLSAIIVAISIYIEYFATGFDIASKQYAYASKNSISQIIFTSIVILMFVNFERFKIFNIIKILPIIFEFVLLMLLKSRATIIGFAICLLYIIFGKQFNKKLKYLLAIFVIVGTLALFINENLLNMVVNNIILSGRDSSDIDAISSGRVSILSEFPTLIQGNWFTGIGAIYFECFPLSCVLQFGIVTGIVIIGISYTPIIDAMKFNKTNLYSSIFVIVCIGYGINSIFEGLAPIGPGVKCYFMWLLYGILCARRAKTSVLN